MENDKVSVLPGVTRRQDPREPVASIVKVCSSLLDLAKRGELRGIGFAIVRSGDKTQVGFSRAPGGEVDSELSAAIGDLFFSTYAERSDRFDDAELTVDLPGSTS